MRIFLQCFAFSLWVCSLNATPAPNFTITTSDGVSRNLYADYVNQQKLVVIEAFFTTCPPCNAHAADWQALYQSMQAAYPGKVEFIMLSTQSFDKNTNVATYKTTKGLTMLGAGENGGSLTALEPYTTGQFGDFLGTPTFIVIAPGTGEVTFDVRGTSPANTMTLLSQKIATLVPATPAPPCSMTTFGNQALAEAQIAVDSPTFDTTITLINGSYALSTVKSLKNVTYTLTPSRNDDALDGVTTLDLALISKHILNVEPLRCPWQLIAADPNCSGTITALDIVVLRRLILGIDETLACGSWKFSPANATASNGTCVEFKGIKSGDVNNAPCPQSANRGGLSLIPVQLLPDFEKTYAKSGENIRIPVYVNRTMAGITGMQAAWKYDPQLMDIQSVESDALTAFSDEFYHVNANKGTIRIVWNHPDGLTTNQNNPLFYITATARQDIDVLENVLQLDPAAIPAEMDDSADSVYTLQWTSFRPFPTGVSIAPNPAQGLIQVYITTENALSDLIQVFDTQGKAVFSKTFDLEKGRNILPIDLSSLASGVYFLKKEGQNAGKIVLYKG